MWPFPSPKALQHWSRLQYKPPSMSSLSTARYCSLRTDKRRNRGGQDKKTFWKKKGKLLQTERKRGRRTRQLKGGKLNKAKKIRILKKKDEIRGEVWEKRGRREKESGDLLKSSREIKTWSKTGKRGGKRGAQRNEKQERTRNWVWHTIRQLAWQTQVRQIVSSCLVLFEMFHEIVWAPERHGNESITQTSEAQRPGSLMYEKFQNAFYDRFSSILF